MITRTGATWSPWDVLLCGALVGSLGPFLISWVGALAAAYFLRGGGDFGSFFFFGPTYAVPVVSGLLLDYYGSRKKLAFGALWAWVPVVVVILWAMLQMDWHNSGDLTFWAGLLKGQDSEDHGFWAQALFGAPLFGSLAYSVGAVIARHRHTR